MPPGSKARPEPEAEAVSLGEGEYVYCVADSGEKASLGEIGLGGREVYTIPCRDLCAVVHSCAARPYRSDDREVVKAWVVAHHRVVEAAWERWGAVLPLSFDTVIKGEGEAKAEQNVAGWLAQEYEVLKAKMEMVKGKAEYGVQVFWNPEVVAQSIPQQSLEIGNLEKAIKAKPRGLAYMYRQRLGNLLKKEMEAKADRCFRDFYRRIRQHSADLRVEKTRPSEDGSQMILNLSCLVDRDRYPELGEELDRINQQEGFGVRVTGPWPPYSFVGNA